MKRSAAFIAVALAAFVAAGGALAGGGAILSGYGGQAGEVMGRVGAKTGPKVVPGTLPFTGLDLTLVALAAAILVVAGVALRRTSRSQP